MGEVSPYTTIGTPPPVFLLPYGTQAGACRCVATRSILSWGKGKKKCYLM